MVYLFCFCISVLFAHLAKKSRSQSMFVFFSLISIAVTVLLAGLRDISIGIDTSNYYWGSWSNAMSLKDMPLLDYVFYYLKSYGKFEPLFIFLIGIVVRLTGNYQVFLTIVHLIIISCVYVGAFRMSKHASPELTLFLFYLFYYGKSLNIFRQYMAIAILFAVVGYIEERKHFRYIIFVIIATLIHNSGVVGLLPLLVFRILYPINVNKQVSYFRKVITCAAVVSGTMLFIPVFQFLINLGIISQRYQYYIDAEKASSYIVSVTFLVVEVIVILIFRKGFFKNNTYTDFYVFSAFAFLMLYIMGTSLSYGNRIPAYFSCINIVSVGMLINSQNMISNKTMVRWGIILVALVYWWYMYPYSNAARTMPYLLCF